jgi:sugar lactone lactonase YvrE
VYGTTSGFDQPEGIAVGSSAAYVVDYTTGSINKYDLLGVFAAWYGGHDGTNDPVGGSANGSFSLPGDAAVDGSGNIYVADTNNQRVQKLDSSGAFVCEIGHGGVNGLQGPLAVAVDSAGHVFVTDFLREQVVRFSPSASAGSYVQSGAWDASKSRNGDLGEPAGVACDAKGNVFVAGSYDNVVTKLSPAGDVLAQWGGTGSSNGKFGYAIGVAVAADGTVYVSERDGDRIQAFTPVDTGPVTFAKAKVTVKKGKTATFTFKAYDDFSAKATYALKIKKGSTVKKTVAVGLKGCTGAWLTKKWTCTLAKGSYKWFVYAKDQTGHAQTTPIGVQSLTVK